MIVLKATCTMRILDSVERLDEEGIWLRDGGRNECCGEARG